MTVLGYERDFILDPSCILYLPLWKKDGSSFISDDKYGHLGTMTGAYWTPRGRYFDGTDDRIIIADTASLQQTTKISVFLWLKFIDYTSQILTYPIGKHPGWGLSIGGQDAFLNDISVFYNNTTSAKIESTATGFADIGTTRYFSVGFTYNGAATNIFLDGKLLGTRTTFTGSINSSGNDLSIGRRTDAAWHVNGYIGDVIIYDRPLTSLETHNLHEATKWRYH